MLNYPFSMRCKETKYRSVTYKNAIGDPSVINGTMDDCELEIVDEGYIRIFYDRELAIDISIVTEDFDEVKFTGEQYLSNRSYGNVCKDAVGREEELCCDMQGFLNDLNALILSLEKNSIQKSNTINLRNYEAENWEQLFIEFIESIGFYYTPDVSVKEEYLPDFKELKYHNKVVFI